jgi:glutamine amidotransferase
MIAIIDYGAGNLRSIERALVHHGASTVITSDPDQIAKADGLVFPGVGNARAAMDRLRASGIADAITSSVNQGKPILGVCLGMQLLFGEQAASHPKDAAHGLEHRELPAAQCPEPPRCR